MSAMSSLLHFAYFGSMGPWTVPYFAAGVILAVVAGRRIQGPLRLSCITFTVAVFFSLTLLVDRTAVLVPTLFAAGLWCFDAAQSVLHPPECRSSLEGCMPSGMNAAMFVVPFLVQWAALHVLLLAVRSAWRANVRQGRRKDARGQGAA